MTRSLRCVVMGLAGLTAIACCATVWAQQGAGGRGGRGGGGGFFGGPGMGGFASPYMLLSSDAVVKELELVDDQKAKIKEINDKARATAREGLQGLRDLSPEERQKRMTEMRDKMQSQRNETNKALQAVLLDHQIKRLKEIYLQLRGEQALRDPEVQTALGLSEDQKKKIRSPLEILTDEQKAAFDKLQGAKFDVSTIRFGGQGGGRRGGNRGAGGQAPNN